LTRSRLVVALVLAVALAAAAARLFEFGKPAGSGEALAAVSVPDLTAGQKRGEALFGANCETCHGANAAGKDGSGPPLVHKIYRPGHHADIAFRFAVQRGVRSHHWRFGDMPPVAGVSGAEVDAIVAYVRALQRANGID